MRYECCTDFCGWVDDIDECQWMKLDANELIMAMDANDVEGFESCCVLAVCVCV